jgi:DNA polymerase III delta prime subunit
MNNEFLFIEKYRPKTVDDCILPEQIKSYFIELRDSGNVPNLLLSGPSGTGKTSVTLALADELGRDFIKINGSEERSIDVIRNKVKSYASTISLSSTGKKFLLIDEADNLTHDAQLALRAFIEDFQSNCVFIFTCNYKNRIDKALCSRCINKDFNFPSDEKQKILARFFKSVCTILETENIEFDKKVVASYVGKYYPDFRRTLLELQGYARNGIIDVGILGTTSDVSVIELFQHIKSKNYANVRKWVVQNIDNDPSITIRKIFDELWKNEEIVKATIPPCIVILAKYQDLATRVADQEINMMSCVTEIMYELEFSG